MILTSGNVMMGRVALGLSTLVSLEGILFEQYSTYYRVAILSAD